MEESEFYFDTSMKLKDVVRSIPAKVTPEGEPSKEFDLEFDLSNCTIEDVIELALRPRRITWQNAMRYNEKLKKLGSTVKIIVKPIGTRETKVVTVDDIMKKASKLSPEKKAELAAQLTALIAD
jgi:hypothetical protein